MRFLFDLLSLMSLYSRKSIVENGDYPLCKNCIHYRPSIFDVFSCDDIFGKCTLYARKDVVSGHIYYEFASKCRTYKKCGIEGKKFISTPMAVTKMEKNMETFYPPVCGNGKYVEKGCFENQMKYSLKTEVDENEKKEGKKREEKKYSPIFDSENENKNEENCSTEFCNECYPNDCKKTDEIRQ